MLFSLLEPKRTEFHFLFWRNEMPFCLFSLFENRIDEAPSIQISRLIVSLLFFVHVYVDWTSSDLVSSIPGDICM